MQLLDGITLLYSWAVFVLHLRVFETTANLITIISYVFSGSLNFLILFFLVNVAIASSLYLISMT